MQQKNPFDLGWAEGWAPPPQLTTSQWSDKYRTLSSKASAEYGQWKTSRTPYLEEPMDCLSPLSPIQLVAMQFAAQLGKTEAGMNWLGSTADLYPGPGLIVQPTILTAKRFSKQRLDPMIRETERLREIFNPQKSRDSENTLDLKEFRAGMWILSGANSAASLASMPIRYLFMDEADRFPLELEDEGDAYTIAMERANSYGYRKKVLVTSTPTIKGASKIESIMEGTDFRRYFCPCPHCAAMDYWRWSSMKWEPGRPETAALICQACGDPIEERMKTWMMAKENGAQWRPTRESKDPLHRGYHLPGMYSPYGWKSWKQLVTQFLEGQKNPTILKTFVNVGLAETWEQQGETHDANQLLTRLEDYRAEVPERVAVLIMSVDVQRDRIEAQIMGWGPGEESWLIEHQRFEGAPATDPNIWDEVEEMRLKVWTRADGFKMRPAICLIDAGDGANLDPVVNYIRPRQPQWVFAVRGVEFHTRPVLVQDSQMKRGKVRLFTVATNPAKQLIFDRLKIKPIGEDEPNPGYVHLPIWTTEEWCQQVTGESLVPKENKHSRKIKYVWIKTHANNEALDMTVYSLAGLRVLQMLKPAAYKDLHKAHEITKGRAEITTKGRRVLSSLKGN